jgi:hypothetical protein
MREPVTIDLRGAWAKVQAAHDVKPGCQKLALSNEQEWILWLAWETKGQSVTCEALGHGKDFCRNNFNRLKKQGGPKGARPEWMK